MDRSGGLRRALCGYEPADEFERGFVVRMRALLDSPGDPFDRRRFDPGHMTSSGYVLSPEGDDLLLIRHAVLERWLQPGGHVESDDHDMVAAARREIREETGLDAVVLVVPGDAPFDLDVHPIPARRGQPAHHHFDVRYLFRARSRGIESGSDAEHAAWVPLDRVPDLHTGASSPRVLRKICTIVAR